MATRGLRVAVRLALAAGLAWVLSMVLLWWQQEALLFHPQALPADHAFDLGPDVHEVWIDVPGARLNALHLRLPRPGGFVLYLHGNGGNLAGWMTDLALYRSAGVDLLMIDYRGYGKSSGRIDSEAQLHADVRAAWDAVAPRYTGLRRSVVGVSIGTGLAAALAEAVRPDATVLVSPYTSLAALAQWHHPWAPVSLLRYPLRTDERIARIPGEIWLLHGGRDTLIPPSHSERLRALAPHARLRIVPEAGHNDIDSTAPYREALQAALRPR